MSKFHHLELRFILIIIISIITITFDEKLNLSLQVRKYIFNYFDLLHYLHDKPHSILECAFKIIKGYKLVILENYALRQELLLKKSELLLLEQYQQENYKLRALINSPLSYKKKKIITKVIFKNTDLWNHYVIINHGIKNGVYVGQPVITDEGIVGQVISVNAYSSRVLLIYDIHHSLSVQIKRNNNRMILIGRGRNDMELYAKCSTNIDARIGDILVTSGLDGRFPEGYPVAVISNFIINKTQDFIIVQAYPTVTFQNLRDVLLIW